jgi:enamine deaminase RidA (YjgF/YER057c/UK114 family)
MHAPFPLSEHLTHADTIPVCQFEFGNGAAEARWPVMKICAPATASVLINHAAREVRDIEIDGRIIGRAFADEYAEYCYLAGVIPADRAAPRVRQTQQCFAAMDDALRQVGMEFLDVVRTWLYLDGLLDWYDDFNAVRTAFFRERGVFNHLVPASTGIGAANPFGAALIAGAVAVKPRSDRIRIFPVQSPLQCPAIDYRSSFSRAVEVVSPVERSLFISGTASIAPDGTSVHVGDCARQVDRTMQVTEAILCSRGMDWSNAVRMIAYFRDHRDRRHFDAWCGEHGIVNPPVTFVEAVVCRDELLFELELDAAES